MTMHPFVARNSGPDPKAPGAEGQCQRCDEAACMCDWELCRCGMLRKEHPSPVPTPPATPKCSVAGCDIVAWHFHDPKAANAPVIYPQTPPATSGREARPARACLNCLAIEGDPSSPPFCVSGSPHRWVGEPQPPASSTPAPPLSFVTLRAVNVPRCVNDFGHALSSWSPAEWTNAMCGEAGEAANVAKKLLRHRDNVAGNQGEDKDAAILREKLGRELADVVIYADLTAAALGIDLGETVREVFNRKSEQIGSKERL